ncbi:hypothetical protein ACOKOP_13885 [Acinetobacter baumannii]
MSLLGKEKALIKNNYFQVWEIISLLAKKTDDDLQEVGEFLGHINISNELPIYQRDQFSRLYELDTQWNNNPIDEIITILNGMYSFCSEEEIKAKRGKAWAKSLTLYWLKEDIYNFKPLMDSEIIEKPSTQVISVASTQEQQSDKYKFFLYKKPLLTLHEAACIMTGHDPQYVELCKNDTNFKQNFSNYLGAYDYISTCIDAQMLSYDSYSNRLCASEFKQFLANENTFINGFNDDLQGAELEKNTDAFNVELQQLKLENEKLKAELAEKDQKIKELETLSPKNDMDLLSLIFDETKTERYSPDLVLAIKLWEHVYIVNPKDDSHSNKADTWLRANTGYDVDKKAGSASKIREVTTPFINWSIHRDKSYTK